MRRRDLLKMFMVSPIAAASGEVAKPKPPTVPRHKYEVALLNTRDTEITQRQCSFLETAETFTFHFKRKSRVRTLAIFRDGVCVYRKLPWGEHGTYVTRDFTLEIHLDLPGLVLENG